MWAKVTLIIFLLTFQFSLLTFPVYAQAPDIGQSRITPASYFYFLKAVKENWQLKFAKSTSAKTLLYLEFATTRLREAKTLLLLRPELVQPTLERYMAELNRLPDKHQDKDEIALKIKEELNIHLAALEQMYPVASSLTAKMAIRSVMNRFIKRADVLSSAKLPVCTLFSQEASSSALNQIEKMVLAARAEDCRKSITASP